MTSPTNMSEADRKAAEHRRIDLFGVPFDVVDFDDTVALLLRMASGDKPTYAVTANLDHVVRFRQDPSVRHLYTAADLVVADGMPLIWSSRLLRKPLPERVAGSDLFPALCARAAQAGLSVYFLGGSPGVAPVGATEPAPSHECCTPCKTACPAPCAADRAASVLKARHPDLRVAGTYCPDFGFEKDPDASAKILDAVRNAGPDILFVGLGSPKQERWIVENHKACGAKLSIGIGVSFSFVCDDVRRAPRWAQRIGLEWAHRLIQEPGRLWRRYLLNGVALPLLIGRELLGRNKPT